MEKKLKHLDFIQIIITRMAVNSFLLKGWTITLIAGVFALSAKDSDHRYILIAYFPVIIFWFLDGYYLYEERLFRSVYDHVRKLDEKDIDFSMKTSSFKEKKGNNLLSCMFSTTHIAFYLSLLLIIIVVMYYF
ncbi:MAG: hypothetical protein NTV98_05145 [Candidatus Roizmanbacteria bacterium]|nr:hypothetical protein [Candidatus Roizmanbacteria bacterium]